MSYVSYLNQQQKLIENGYSMHADKTQENVQL